MTFHTNTAIIGLRCFARKLGLTRHLTKLRGQKGYEWAFDEALFLSLQAGDVVWDVGANVGYYTKRFAAAVGPGGHVVAFEPFPATADRLRAELEGTANYSLMVTALGAGMGKVKMESGTDALGATNRIVDGRSDGIVIAITTGDYIVSKGDVPAPTVVKIDTEGFEMDVLHGMAEVLARPTTRAVFVEVHFGLLAKRGQPSAPAEIERLLKASGFAIRWVDPSHIAAKRV